MFPVSVILLPYTRRAKQQPLGGTINKRYATRLTDTLQGLHAFRLPQRNLILTESKCQYRRDSCSVEVKTLAAELFAWVTEERGGG